MRLSAHGITAELPRGWEGSISDAGRAHGQVRPLASGDRRELAVAHLANFALPSERGDFGSGAVELMSDPDIFVALLEYGPESLGTALFAARGLPRRLRPESFSPRALQRSLPGHAGLQVFCTHGNRALCLYVVLGGRRGVRARVDEGNRVLAGVDVATAHASSEVPG